MRACFRRSLIRGRAPNPLRFAALSPGEKKTDDAGERRAGCPTPKVQKRANPDERPSTSSGNMKRPRANSLHGREKEFRLGRERRSYGSPGRELTLTEHCFV